MSVRGRVARLEKAAGRAEAEDLAQLRAFYQRLVSAASTEDLERLCEIGGQGLSDSEVADCERWIGDMVQRLGIPGEQVPPVWRGCEGLA